MKNWKTTTSGLLVAFIALASAVKNVLEGQPAGDITAIVAAITAGIGLVFAGDAKK